MSRNILCTALVVGVLLSSYAAKCEDANHPSLDHVTRLFKNAEVLPKTSSQSGIDEWVWGGPVEASFQPGMWIPPYMDTLLVTVAAKRTYHVSGLVHRLIAVYDPHSQTLLTPIYHFVGDSLEQRIFHGKEQDFLLYAGGSGGQGYHYDLTRLFEFRKGHIADDTPYPDIQGIKPDRRFVELANDQLKIWECSDEIVEVGNPCKSLLRWTLRWDSQLQKFKKAENEDQTSHP